MHPPFVFKSQDRGHGRDENRVYKIYPIEAMRVEPPHARTLIVRGKTVMLIDQVRRQRKLFLR